jgi:hypothetical protein
MSSCILSRRKISTLGEQPPGRASAANLYVASGLHGSFTAFYQLSSDETVLETHFMEPEMFAGVFSADQDFPAAHF